MKKQIHFTFLGGDQRQRDAVYLLAQEGFSIKIYGLGSLLHENIMVYPEPVGDYFDCDVFMLPIPYKSKEGRINLTPPVNAITADWILKCVPKSAVVLLGKADAPFCEAADKNGISYYDIVAEESFSVLNAIPSAEGALQRAMERTDITIHGARVLILGFGRIGKVLAHMLRGLGARVMVEARRESDLAWAFEGGIQGVPLQELDTVLPDQDIIFNTIPHLILTRDRLSRVAAGCIIIDLASYPGGTDFNAAQDFGIRADLDLSLPGIVAPKTAAKIVCRVTKDILKRHFHYDRLGGGGMS